MDCINHRQGTLERALLILILLLGTAGATTWTVGPLPGPGGTSIGIQAAIDNATAGDIIEVHHGIYTENVNVNKRLTLRGIYWPEVKQRVQGAAITLSADGCTLEGFVVRNSDGGIRAISNNNTISGNNATKNGYGFQLSGLDLPPSNGNTVSNNNAFDNVDYGIYISNSSRNNILDNKFIGSTRRYGICLSDSSGV